MSRKREGMLQLMMVLMMTVRMRMVNGVSVTLIQGVRSRRRRRLSKRRRKDAAAQMHLGGMSVGGRRGTGV